MPPMSGVGRTCARRPPGRASQPRRSHSRWTGGTSSAVRTHAATNVPRNAAAINRLIHFSTDRSYAVVSQLGGLEGGTPSKKLLFPPDWATPRGYPAAQSGGKEGILGRHPEGTRPPQTPPSPKSCQQRDKETGRVLLVSP